MQRRGLWVVLFLVPLLKCAPAHGEDGPSLKLMTWGPDETGYPLAYLMASSSGIESLTLRATDATSGRLHLGTVTAKPGVVMLYRVERIGGEPEGRLFERAMRCARVLRERLKRAQHIGTHVQAVAPHFVVLRSERDALDMGADLASLVRTGEVSIRPRAKAKTAVWPSDAAALREHKTREIERWRRAAKPIVKGEYAPHRTVDDDLRLVRRLGRDGSQPYHFKIVAVRDEHRLADRETLGAPTFRTDAHDPDEYAPVWLPIPPKTRARLEAWTKAHPGDPLAVLLHGAYLHDLDLDDGVPDKLHLDLPTWRCRSSVAWANALTVALRGDPLPGPLHFVARVNFHSRPVGDIEAYVAMPHASSMKITLDAPGVEPVVKTRTHVPGHFAKYRYLAHSYFGGRHCGDIATEEATWVKYQERPLLPFMVAITVSHGNNHASSVMAARMLGADEKDPKESVRRLAMGLHGSVAPVNEHEKPVVLRLACVLALAQQARRDTDMRPAVIEHLTKALPDKVLRVRYAAAVMLRVLGETSQGIDAVLSEGRTSKDKWVALLRRTLPD